VSGIGRGWGDDILQRAKLSPFASLASLKPAQREALLTAAVEAAVRKQVDCGIDIVTDGEFSKPGFFTYIQERLSGFEARPNQKMLIFQKEVAAFPEYYAEYFKQAMMGGTIVSIAPIVCTSPVKYRG
jgi:5-methyltetrahydropteroyltriglutamate--homocysteine methyltransferase